jgi:CubicO group peptidase (beta-lactamase class C family)
MRRALATAALVAVPAAAHAQAPDSAALAARVDSVFVRFEAPGSPGCALGVARGGRLAYARGYGLASIEHAVPITPRTIFDIGSTSKQFAAAAIMLLVEEGKLSLDDDVRKHVPELQDLGAKVTLRHLLAHTSGLRDYTDLLGFAGHDVEGVTTARTALDLLAKQKGANFAPGSEWRYNNTGYFLMSVVVERVTGKTLRAFARERLFAPLGMTRSFFYDDHTEVVPGRAASYAPRGPAGGYAMSMSNWEQVGDGGVQTSIEELARWDAEWDQGAVLSAKVRQEMQTPNLLSDGRPTTYGLGLTVDTYRGAKRVHHGGAWAGYRAMTMRFPEHGLSVLLLCNRGDANTTMLAQRVADAYLGGQLAAATPPGAPPAGGGAVTQSAAVSPAVLASWTGRWFDEREALVYRIEQREGRLVGFQNLGMTPNSITVVSAEEVRLPSGVRLRMAGSGAGATLDRIAPDGRVLGRARRVSEPPTGAALAAYAGRYYTDEIGTPWVASVKDGRLVMRIGTGPDYPLTPAADVLFASPVGPLAFEKDARGRVVALRVVTRGAVGLRMAKE